MTARCKGQVCLLQLTDATGHTVQLLALMDARDSGTTWDFRCYVREKLIDFLQRNYPESLPRTREVDHLPEVPPSPKFEPEDTRRKHRDERGKPPAVVAVGP